MAERMLTPYDTGARLEPKVWVNRETGRTGSDEFCSRPAIADDYGKIDLEDESSQTVATIWAEIDGTDKLTIFVTNTAAVACVAVEVELER